jgi:hypothetical protein
MPMNKLTYHRLIPLLLLAVVAVSVLAAGADNPASVPNQAAKAEETAQTRPAADGVGPDTQKAAEQSPPVSGAAAGPVKEFKPTEKIEADSAVSFPIDI